MTKKERLLAIRKYLWDNVFTNNLIFEDVARGVDTRTDKEIGPDLLSIIATLYNELWEAETGKHYDYFFHHTGNMGWSVEDRCFDENGKLKGNDDYE